MKRSRALSPPSGEERCAYWPADFDPVYGCWHWLGSKHPDGYGLVSGGKSAHRHVYETEVGPIPEGLELEHCCKRRGCVAPAHLEPVKRRENEHRKRWAWQVARKHCPAGHSLWEHGRRTPQGGKVCRVCSGV